MKFAIFFFCPSLLKRVRNYSSLERATQLWGMVFGFGLLSPSNAANIRINYAYANAHKGLGLGAATEILAAPRIWNLPQFSSVQFSLPHGKFDEFPAVFKHFTCPANVGTSLLLLLLLDRKQHWSNSIYCKCAKGFVADRVARECEPKMQLYSRRKMGEQLSFSLTWHIRMSKMSHKNQSDGHSGVHWGSKREGQAYQEPWLEKKNPTKF